MYSGRLEDVRYAAWMRVHSKVLVRITNYKMKMMRVEMRDCTLRRTSSYADFSTSSSSYTGGVW